MLNQERQRLALDYYDSVTKYATIWAYKNNAVHFLEDFKSSAYLALVESADRFDEKKGFIFTTYLFNMVKWRLFVTLKQVNGFERRNCKKTYKWVMNYVALDLTDEILDTLDIGCVEDCHGEIDFYNIVNSARLLTDSEKEVLIGVFVNDKNLAEIGRGVGMSREAIRQKYSKAIEKVRKFLNN